MASPVSVTGTGPKYVGKHVQAKEGMRVCMAPECQNKGIGTIVAVPGSGYVSVRWDNGTEEKAVFTGQNNDYFLVVADTAFDSNSSLHKQLLAQEVVKLRREVAQLRAARQDAPGGGDGAKGGDSAINDQLKAARIEIARLEAEKQEIIAQANTQKEKLAKEVKQLRQELERVSPGGGGPPSAAPYKHDPEAQGPSREVAEALLRKREFEDNFTRTLRLNSIHSICVELLSDLRKELENTSLKYLSSRDQVPMGVRTLLQLSNEKIDKVMEETAQVPVEERLHIEALRLLMENAKLRKCLNEYSEGLLHNTLVKIDPAQDEAAT